MSSYECDYGEENGLQKCKQEIEKAPLVSRINRRLLYEGKQLGVCHRGAVICDNRGDLSLANPCSCRRVTGIFPTRARLTTAVAGVGNAGRESYFWDETRRFTCLSSLMRKSRQQAHRV